MVFEQLANAVLSFVNWGITIVVIMLIWEIIQFIRGGTEDRGVGEWQTGRKSLGEIKDSFNEWTGRKEVQKQKKIKRQASRDKTRLLNEYIEEKKEKELLDKALVALKEFDDVADKAINNGIDNKKAFTASFNELKKALQESANEINRLKRATWRQERQTDRLIKELEEVASDKELQALKALDRDILVRHDKVVKSLAESQSSFVPISQAVSAVNTAKTPIKISDSIKGKTLQQHIRNARVALDEVEKKLKEAVKEQAEAYKEVEGLIARMKKLWES